MMSLLLEFNADLKGRVISFDGEPNVTLLYDASYFGHAHMVRFLIQQKAKLDTPVKFQDDMSITYTALHIASKVGRYEVVKALLAAKAQISAAPATLDDADMAEGKLCGPPELKDAVDGCHVDIVRLLVKSGAQLFIGPPGR